jgi:hypothetical protein
MLENRLASHRGNILGLDLIIINSWISRLCALHWLPTVCVDLVKAPKIATGLGVSVSTRRVE